MATKVCNHCNVKKDVSDFKKGKGYKDGIRPQCIECARKYNLQSFHKNKHKHPYNYEEDKNRKLQRAYGISYQQYLEMLDAQDGKCAICGTEDTGKRKAFAVDHCHECGEVRGLLCSNCNTGIGNLREDIEIMERAIAYVRYHQERA